MIKAICTLLVTIAAMPTVAIDRLPTGARLDPAGRLIPVGNMPLSMAIAPDHRHAVVTLSGWLTQGLQVVDLESGRVTQTIEKNSVFSGITFGGEKLYVSGGNDNVVYVFSWRDGRLGEERSIAVKYPAGLALSADGRMLYAAENLADDIAVVDLATSSVVQRLPTDHYPYDIEAGGDRVFVSAWGGNTVSMFRAASDGRLVATGRLAVGRHPSGMCLGGSTLYVALASVNQIAVVDTIRHRVLTTLSDRAPSGPDQGSTPNALAVAGDRLYAAEADNNAVAVFDVKSGTLLGRIPTDWYPLAVAVDDDRLVILNGKGAGTRPNPAGPRPGKPLARNPQYDLAAIDGSVEVVPLPADLAALSRRVAVANNWTQPRATPRYPPFRHIVYVIKENRTYDQVLGDLPKGDGDPSLVFFGRNVTPNEHSFAERFGLFDRFFVNAEVSSQGHIWSDAAYVTDYTEKTTQTVYAHKRPDVDEGEVDEPANGFLWDSALRSGIKIRVYGEFAEPVEKTTQFRATKRAAQADINPDYPAFDLKITDQHRADIWIAELGEFVRNGEMPALEIVQLPRDHTAAGKAGYSTPRACVADNDLALGRMVEALSKTPYWRDTLMIALEDDAQDGADHVDSHRSPFFMISAYNRPGVQHRFTNTTDAVATIEGILGLDPLSQFDWFGRPVSEVFSDTPDLTAYRAITPAVPLDEVNPERGEAAKESSSFDLTRPDAVDSAAFNKVLSEIVAGTSASPR